MDSKRPFNAYRCKICKVIFQSMSELMDHWNADHNDGFHVFDFTTLQDKREKRNLNLD